MNSFWNWFEQQEELKMCDNKQGNVKRTPHPHAEVIKAWADGAKVQGRVNGAWMDCDAIGVRFNPNWEYRIKPEPATDLETYGVEVGDVWQLGSGIKITTGHPLRYDINGFSITSKLCKLVFRRGVINRLSEV